MKNSSLKKRIVSAVCMLALVITLVVPGVGAAATDYSTIKVLLTSMGSPSSVTFVVKGAYRIAEAPTVDLYPGVTYTMKVSGTGMALTYNNGVGSVTVNLGANATFKQYDNGSSGNYLYLNNVKYGWRYYKGDMKFIRPSGTSYLRLVNSLFFETYLYGVVAYEMSNSWPLEALKVQAVSARTYSLRYIKANYSNYYHIGDTSSHQVYCGFPMFSDGKPHQRVIDAVDATRGQVVLLGAPSSLNPADGMFSASNGGQIKTVQMQYGSTNTYHVFKDDPWDLKNTASPTFRYIFPTKYDAATLDLLSATDRDKVVEMARLVKPKAAAALRAQGINCADTDIAIVGYKSAVPCVPRAGMPAGSKLFTRVNVTLTVSVNGAEPQQGRVQTAGGSLNIRSQASTSASILKSAPNGALLTVLDTKAASGWYKVQYAGVTGYASSAYIVLLEPVATPSPSPTPEPTASPTVEPTATAAPTEEPVQSPSAEPSASATAASGGGASPYASYTKDVTVTLTYISQSSGGDWDVYGELKANFARFSTLINSKNLWNLYSEASADGKFLYVVARGYGHGVGMSQRGAQQMANEGKTCADILEFYYNFEATSASLGALALTDQALQPIPGNGASAQYAKVYASSVNVRAAASTAATSVYVLPQNARVEVLSTSGDWYRVLYEPAGIVGWACSKQGASVYIGPLTPPATASPEPTQSPADSPSASPEGSASAEPSSTAAETASATVSPSETPSPTPESTASASPSPSPAPSQTAAPTATVTPTPSPTPTPTAAPVVINPVTGKANVTSYLSLRKTPSTSAATLTRIPRNGVMTVTLVYTNPIWYKVTYAGKTGYVLARYVIVGGSTAYRAGTVTASTALNVRAAAGTKYAVLGTLKSGATVLVTGTAKVGTATWYRILYGAKSGYVDARYLRKAP